MVTNFCVTIQTLHTMGIEIPAKDLKQDATSLGDWHTHYTGIGSTRNKRVSLKVKKLHNTDIHFNIR